MGPEEHLGLGVLTPRRHLPDDRGGGPAVSHADQRDETREVFRSFVERLGTHPDRAQLIDKLERDHEAPMARAGAAIRCTSSPLIPSTTPARRHNWSRRYGRRATGGSRPDGPRRGRPRTCTSPRQPAPHLSSLGHRGVAVTGNGHGVATGPVSRWSSRKGDRRQRQSKAGAYRNVPRMVSVQAVNRRIRKCAVHAGYGGRTPNGSASSKPNRE